jgi:transposase
LRNGKFYLCVAVEVQEEDAITPIDALGVDLGIVNIAVDSDGETHSGDKVLKVRDRTAKLCSGL